MSYGEGDTARTPHIGQLTHRAARIEELRQNLFAMRVENADLRVLMHLLNENPQLYMLYLHSTSAGRKVLASPLTSTATSSTATFSSAAPPSAASPSSSVTSSAASTTSSSSCAASTTSSAASASTTDVSVVSSSSSVNSGYWGATPTTSPGVTGRFSRRVTFAESSPTRRTSENTRQDTGPSDTPTHVNTQTSKGHALDTEGTEMSCSTLDQADHGCPTRHCTRTAVSPSERVLGEIAYQLERRILGYIFSRPSRTDSGDRPIHRFYGYSVSSIRTLIRQEYTNSDGSLDDDTKLMLKNRLRDIMICLGMLGYKMDEHGRFAQVMINKHGVFRRGVYSKTMEAFCLDDPEALRRFISLHARDDKEIKNMNILLECLLFFSDNDGMPVFNL